MPYYEYALDLMLDADSAGSALSNEQHQLQDIAQTQRCMASHMQLVIVSSTMVMLFSTPQVPYYEYALDLVLDVESPGSALSDEQHELLEAAAELLYGLVHARYIVTARGLATMLEKCAPARAEPGPCCYVAAEHCTCLDPDHVPALCFQPVARCVSCCVAWYISCYGVMLRCHKHMAGLPSLHPGLSLAHGKAQQAAAPEGCLQT